MISLVTEFTSLMNAVTSSLNYQYPGTLWAFLPLFLVIATYLMPSIIALINNKRPVSVAILNLSLGWTFIVWFILLCWVTWKSAQPDIKTP
jgi:hypothetical protein